MLADKARPLFHFTSIVCLSLGLVASFTPAERVARADTPPPPTENLPATAPTDAAPFPNGAALGDNAAELHAGLAALEAARNEGLEAVVALLDTLSGQALDLAMDEIVEAQLQLAKSAPPRPVTRSVSPAEEEAALQAQLAREAANRAKALALSSSPDEGGTQAATLDPQSDALRRNPSAPAVDRTVGSGCTYAQISHAIAAANSGDTLLIEGGVTFNERFTIDKNLTLQGGYDGCTSGSTDRTVVDGGAGGLVIAINPGLTVTLENLNVTNGSTGSEGGGIRFALSSGSGAGQLNLNHVDIYNNTGYWGGGLWVGSNAEVIGTDVEIYDNTANIGGGVRLWGGRATLSGGSNIRNNTALIGAGVAGGVGNSYAPVLNLPSSADVRDNQALTGSGFGGGIYMQQGSVTLASGSDLYSNDAIQGGGAYLISSTLTIAGSLCEIQANTATGDGGGVYAQGSTVNLDDQAELLSNRAGTDGTGSGGGAYLDDSDLWGDGASIRLNRASTYAGGVYATNSSLLDMDLGGYACTGPRCSQLSNNTATSRAGGVYASSSEVDLRQTFVEDNTGQSGGAVFAYFGDVYLYNSLIAGNEATSSGYAGDGLQLWHATVTGSENTLAYNPASGSGHAIAFDEPSTLTLARSIIWGHTTSLDDAGQTITCSDVQGGYAGTGNLNVDPLFVDPASANFHLQSLSPVIDRCTGGLSVDFDNEARPLTYVRPTTPYDMGADEAAPRVGINGAPCAYGRIQDAVDAASPGDTIQAAADTYSETVDITKTLTIAGGYDADCITYAAGTTTVDGSSSSGSVFDVTGGTVTLRDMAITGGNVSLGGGVDVRGDAQVTLDNSDVFGNQASYGGGLYISTGSTVTLTNDSDVTNNTATTNGGGARVLGKLVSDDWASKITNNSAPNGGGVAVPGGVLHFDGSHVTDNIATGAQGKGGGIYVYAGGVVTLTGSSNISRNDAYDGAGIYADAASVYLRAAVHSNAATHSGGGVYLTNDSTLRATETYVGYSAAGWGGNEAARGGGVYAVTSTVDFAGNIYNNLASVRGAGIHAEISTITLTNASVGGTEANQANRLASSSSYGVGLYLDNRTHAMLSNTVVASNTFPATAAMSYGGGAYVTGGSVMTLTNSSIERHLAPSATDGRGAGIYLSNATLTLENSQVLSNTAGTLGGGVRLYGDSTLNVLDGSEISSNQALNGEGGGIAAAAIGTPDINITDATLQNNTASTDGGAIYLSAGTLDFSGWWNVRGNSAGGNGGAVAVTGSGDVDLVANSSPANLINNDAGGNGGALYVDNDDTVELYATTPRLFVTVNTAAGNGGAAYAGNGGGFDVRGRLRANANSALGNGGAFYLGDSSQLSLDVYGSDSLRFELNYADNGGAVYAAGGSTVRCNGAEFGRPDAAGNLALAGGSGGALYLSGSVLTSTNCLFRNNHAPANGGAIAAYTSTVTIGADYATCSPTAAQCSAIYSNTADSDGNNDGYGGGLYAGGSIVAVDHTSLHRNSAAYGGAIYQTGVALGQVHNSLIYSNSLSYASGAGAGIRNRGGVLTVTHTTIANNTGSGFAPLGASSVVSNSIAWGNSGGGFIAGTYVMTSCTIDQSGVVGAALDPQFVAAGAGEDYHLLGSSPAINACATGMSPDLDNVPRPVAGSYDMGAYEYAYGVAFAPDQAGTGLPEGDVSYAHWLTNTGGTADTFTLMAHSGQGWSVSIVPTPSVTLDGGQSTPLTVTVSVPAGSLSETVDVVVVTATSGADPNLVAAVVDTTTVGFAPGVALASDGLTTGAVEGHTYTYTHWLTNTGNYTDTFELIFASSAAWGELLDTGPFTLGPALSTTVRVSVSVPSGGGGQVDTSVVTATSQGGAGPVVVHDVTSAFVPGVEFVPDHTQTVAVETVVTYTHQLTNTGNATDTFTLAWSTSRGWGELLDTGPFTLTQNATQTVRVRVSSPAASGGLTETTVVTATSAGGAGPAVVRDTTATYEPGLALTPDYTDAVDAGASITYTHRLTNTGEYTDTFDLVLSADLNWATLLDPGPFTLGAGEMIELRVRVDVPQDGGGLVNTLELEASSRAGGISAAATDTITVVRTYGVALVPDHTQSVNPGEVITYTHWLTNTGNGADKFDLALSSSRGWATLLDPGPFDLLAGTGITVRVRVDAPASSGGLSEVTHLVVTSQLSPTIQASATDTTISIYLPGLSLTPDYGQSVLPGSLLTYTHWLTNTGNGTDQFSLDWSSSQGWATLLDLGPYSLDEGEGIGVQVRVSVPSGSGGLVDTTHVTAAAQSGGVSASATDVTTATRVSGVQLIPDRAASILPGQAHIYTHTLSNTGNGPDTIGLTLTSSLGWASLLDSGPFSLGTGGSTELRVRVQVPAGVISGSLTEMTIITATSYADPARGDLSIDTSTVGFLPGLAFGPDHTNVGAVPGEVYTYTHWLTNTGNYTDTFELSFSSSITWGELVDSGPFTLGPGLSTTVRVSVSMPASGGAQFDTSIVTATSQGGAGPVVVHDTTSAFSPGVDLVPSCAQVVAAGSVVTYTHRLTNTGTSTDTFRLDLSSSRGWAALLDPGPFELAGGAFITVRVAVTAPAGSGGLADVTVVTARALGGAGPAAAVTDTTSVVQVAGVALAPDYEAIELPGSSVVYTHRLTNTGNGPDVFLLELHSGLGWGSLLDAGPFDLAAGEGAPVRVELSLPPGSGGLVETVLVTATSQANPGVQASLVDTVTAVYSVTVSRTDMLAAGVYTFGDTCAQLSFADDADRGGLTAVTVTLVYAYPTGQLAARPLPRHYTIEGDRSSGFSATLSLCYLDAEWTFVGIGDESALQLYRYGGVPTWEPYSSTVDTAGNTVTATIHAFSPWAIGAPGHEPTAIGLHGLASRAASSLRVPLGAILGVGVLYLAGWWTLGRRRNANERSQDAP